MRTIVKYVLLKLTLYLFQKKNETDFCHPLYILLISFKTFFRKYFIFCIMWSNYFWSCICIDIRYHEIIFESPTNSNIYLVHDINPPNNPSCFPQFFPGIFLSLSSWIRKQTFYWSKQVFSLFWTNGKFVFIFKCSNWEMFLEKIGENKIGCLVVRCLERDNSEFLKYSWNDSG